MEKDDEHHFLKAESRASASAIVYKDVLKVYDYPKVKWRWKASSVYTMGAIGSKAGDDYPICVYIISEYELTRADVL